MEPYLILTIIGWIMTAIAGFILFVLVPRK